MASEQSSTPESQTDQSSQGYITLEEYIDLINNNISDTDVFQIRVYRENDFLVYEYKLKSQINAEAINTLITNLDNSESSNEPLFRSVIDEMRDYTGNTYHVKRVYLNADGSMIRTVEYT